MNLTIHRGTKEIGGSCVELESQGTRIVIDIGMPLVNSDGSAFEFEENKRAPQELINAGILPPIKGFYKGEENAIDALIISHGHQDHYGFAKYVNPEIPIFLGEATHSILKVFNRFVSSGVDFKNTKYMKDRKSEKFGPFEITPFLADHSAYDSYSVLIIANGKNLFYSGDFRGHGRKAALFQKLIRQPPKNIDALLMEGSTIGRDVNGKEFSTEIELVQKYVAHFKSTKGMCLVWSSSQNIDRIVTIYKAAHEAGRQLIIDLYTAEILRATGNNSIPQGFWKGIKVFIPFFYRKKIKDEKAFEILTPYRANRIFPEMLAEESGNSVLLFRPSMGKDLDRAKCLEGASLAYSLWDGYLEQPAQKPFLEWLDRNHIPMKKIHTSGHASVKDLQRLAKAINPKHLIPIHTFERDQYKDLFSNVTILDDAQVFEI